MLIKGVLSKFMQVDVYNIAHMINQPKRLMVSTKRAQRIKCGIGLNTIILQYYTMPNKKKKIRFYFTILVQWGKVEIFFNILFSKEKD
jgi:hypothetical protein